jgi:hypothetical protein
MRLGRSTFLTLLLAGFALVIACAPVMASPGPSSGTATLLSGTQAPEIPQLVAVRAAHHPGFDRVVFEFSGSLPRHSVSYVTSLTEDASGRPLHLAGDAIIKVRFEPASAHDDSGAPTVTPAGRRSPGLPSLAEIVPAGDFEAVVTYGLGIDHRVPFKVLELRSPSRLAVDISTTASSPSAPAASGGADNQLPFTGARTTGLLITGLSLAATGLLVLALARTTRTP